MMKFYNAANDTLVTFKGDDLISQEFVILGDESQVSDRELALMSVDVTPDGWVRS